MPVCTYIPRTEARIATYRYRRLGEFMDEYLGYIQRVPQGRAGRLHVSVDEPESPLTVRGRLAAVAKAFTIPLTIRCTGQDVFFWREDEPALTR
jgi:hypothetical protein